MPQWMATSQFYLYGREYCTKNGYDKALANRKGDDILESNIKFPESVFIVTGANSGIGKEIALNLARFQSTVYLFCRNAERAEAAKTEIVAASQNEKVHVIICDVSLETGVRQAMKDFISHSGGKRLDALVCNAGVLLNEPKQSSEGVEITFASHLLFGTFLLTQLAIPILGRTEGSRVVCVSSAGMYNTKFPDFNVATSRKGNYDGNLVYAYAKRGQVLLCEEWSRTFPKIKFVSSHPGWTKTAAVEEAYGESAKYLEPMRSTYEGADGIIWLCVAGAELLQSGEFYLDRLVCRKHLAGPFFTDGSYTKNSKDEVNEMMKKLNQWSTAEGRPEPIPFDVPSPLNSALTPSQKMCDIKAFMGKWHVWSVIPTPFEPDGLKNSVEKYEWNDKLNCVNVVFEYFKPGSTKKVITKQRGFMDNATNTQWSLKLNAIGNFYVPVPLKYLILEIDEEYETSIVGVPNREFVWLLSRNPVINEERYSEMVKIVDNLGFNIHKLVKPEYDASLEEAVE